MLIFLAIVLLLVLPHPWNLVGFLVVIPLWVLELLGWSRTVKHKRKAVGAETLIGRNAVVSTPLRPRGQVRLDGEIWEARCEAGAAPGETVRVIGRDSLTLLVERAAEADTTESGGHERPVGVG
jgi:membrane protein implicated in regulation of membrane protease activity